MRGNAPHIVQVYGLDYCAHVTALYIDGNKVSDELRGSEDAILCALGYTDIPTYQVDQDWIEDLGWVFPEKLLDVHTLPKTS